MLYVDRLAVGAAAHQVADLSLVPVLSRPLLPDDDPPAAHTVASLHIAAGQPRVVVCCVEGGQRGVQQEQAGALARALLQVAPARAVLVLGALTVRAYDTIFWLHCHDTHHHCHPQTAAAVVAAGAAAVVPASSSTGSSASKPSSRHLMRAGMLHTPPACCLVKMCCVLVSFVVADGCA